MKLFYNTTLIYALLIFIGFLNTYSYYSEFGIEIVSFLTTGELLLSFLPLTLPILILVAFAVLFYIILLTQSAYNISFPVNNYVGDEPNDFIFNLKNAPKQLIAGIREISPKSAKFYLNILIFMFQFIVSLAVLLFLFFYVIIFITEFLPRANQPSNLAGQLWLGGIFWIWLFDSFLVRSYKERDNLWLARIFLFLSLSISCMWSNSKKKAIEIISGNPQQIVEFQYEGNQIVSGPKVLFIGATEKYIFFRNIEKNKNLIYPISEIKNLSMVPVEEKID
ncbi:MAG TPA: hypothetical protein VFD29_10245 [Gillisia sp.]|nr:hypothetical protein [Gillisia sp.]